MTRGVRLHICNPTNAQVRRRLAMRSLAKRPSMWFGICAAVAIAGICCPLGVDGEFQVYWNIPSFQCKPFRLPEIDVTAEFGIVQNADDQFRGQHITILYDPGLFPALFASPTPAAPLSPPFRRNGGVPQAGHLNAHLARFASDLDEQMPDRHNDGLAVIDFESWRPVFRQNFGSLEPYKQLSCQLVRDRHGNTSEPSDDQPPWTEKHTQTEAARLFERAARDFMLETLLLAQRLRPFARWGYYGLPFCFNEKKETCAAYIRDENDSFRWLFDAAQAVYPSVYWTEKFAAEHRLGMVRGRVAEAQRMARFGQPVLVYHRYVYADTRRYLDMTDTAAIFQTIKESGAAGIILWGASGDMNNRNKCETFHEYVLDTLGPAAAAVIESDDDGDLSVAAPATGRQFAPLFVGLSLLGVAVSMRCTGLQ